ncbi:hypothetical protein J6590_015112 [Homalodisca vitripennis]|nr:hypothetical protein J6590_015112 [Homalodisca vitripennis]
MMWRGPGQAAVLCSVVLQTLLSACEAIIVVSPLPLTYSYVGVIYVLLDCSASTHLTCSCVRSYSSSLIVRRVFIYPSLKSENVRQSPGYPACNVVATCVHFVQCLLNQARCRPRYRLCESLSVPPLIQLAKYETVVGE